MNKENKKMIKFFLGFISTSLAGLGWLCIFEMGKSYMLYIAFPIILFIGIIGSLMLTSWVNEIEYKESLREIEKVASVIVYGTHIANSDKDLIEHLKDMIKDYILSECSKWRIGNETND